MERSLTWTSLPAETPDEHLPATRKKQPHEILGKRQKILIFVLTLKTNNDPFWSSKKSFSLKMLTAPLGALERQLVLTTPE
jgi:hypothetical protein